MVVGVEEGRESVSWWWCGGERATGERAKEKEEEDATAPEDFDRSRNHERSSHLNALHRRKPNISPLPRIFGGGGTLEYGVIFGGKRTQRARVRMRVGFLIDRFSLSFFSPLLSRHHTNTSTQTHAHVCGLLVVLSDGGRGRVYE